MRYGRPVPDRPPRRRPTDDDRRPTVRADGDGSVWIRRDPAAGTIDVEIRGMGLAALVVEHGRPQLAERVRRAVDPDDDAAAIAEALAVVLSP